MILFASTRTAYPEQQQPADQVGRVYSVVSVLLTLLANKQADGGPATLVSVAEVGSLSSVLWWCSQASRSTQSLSTLS